MEIKATITEEMIEAVIVQETIRAEINGSVNITQIDNGIFATTAEPIGGHKVIYIDPSGFARVASADNPDCFNLIAGVSSHAATTGDVIEVRYAGALDGFSFGTLGLKYLGLDGMLQSTPHANVLKIIGNAVSETRLIITNESPILRI